MQEKIKNYYRNSPKRIGWSWFGVHVAFLFVGLLYLDSRMLAVFSSILAPFVISVPMILVFPSTVFLNLLQSADQFVQNPPLWSVWLHIASPLYYTLFFVMVYKAKNTSSMSYRILSIIFTMFFVVSVISSFYYLRYYPLGK